jgi:hypothetical protein
MVDYRPQIKRSALVFARVAATVKQILQFRSGVRLKGDCADTQR